MATLKVDSKANPAFTFPETLAVAFLSQHDPSKLCTVQYEATDCLSHKPEEYVELAYDGDQVLKNRAIVAHVQEILSGISKEKNDLVSFCFRCLMYASLYSYAIVDDRYNNGWIEAWILLFPITKS
jgi:hypothetical protein